MFFLCVPQPKLYKSVIEDVINEVRELFLDEGVDEQVLLELKTVTGYGNVLSSHNFLKRKLRYSLKCLQLLFFFCLHLL